MRAAARMAFVCSVCMLRTCLPRVAWLCDVGVAHVYNRLDVGPSAVCCHDCRTQEVVMPQQAGTSKREGVAVIAVWSLASVPHPQLRTT